MDSAAQVGFAEADRKKINVKQIDYTYFITF